MKKPTQKDKTLAWLQTNGDLTFKDAVSYLNILDVRKRIEEPGRTGIRL